MTIRSGGRPRDRRDLAGPPVRPRRLRDRDDPASTPSPSRAAAAAAAAVAAASGLVGLLKFLVFALVLAASSWSSR